MVPYYALDAIDTFLKELMNEPNLPFGGKVIVLGFHANTTCCKT